MLLVPVNEALVAPKNRELLDPDTNDLLYEELVAPSINKLAV